MSSHGPAERSKPSRFDRRKEEILNAAGALFNRHGLRDATLAVIAAEIGLNLKSLRYYFERREDLVAAAFLRSIDLYRQLVQDALTEDDACSRIRRFIRQYFALQASVRTGERPEFVHFGDLRALTEPHSAVVLAEYNQLFRAIRKLFRTPARHWEPAKLNAATHMLLSQLHWSVVWMNNYLVEDLPRVADRLSDVLLRGIAARSMDLSRFVASVPPQAIQADRLSQEAFLRTATSLINQFGYRGASVDRISAELKVTKGAFYHHNETRDGLVVACFEQTFARTRQAQQSALRSERDGLSRIVGAAVTLVTSQMLDTGTLLRTSALTAIGPELRARMADSMARLTSRFGDMANDGIIDGSVVPCDVRIAAEVIGACINSAEELALWVTGATADTAAELYVRPLLVGILADST